MLNFVLAFPIGVDKSSPFKFNDNYSFEEGKKGVVVPGCSVILDVIRNDASENLSELFLEHREISAAEASAIDSHKSLLFLLGKIKSVDDLRSVNGTIVKMFGAGAKGVYMQQSGTAWTPDAFAEVLLDGDFPMDPWTNYVGNDESLYSLGLEAFGLPDLCISRNVGSDEELENILSVASDSLFVEKVPCKSGTEIDVPEVGVFRLRQEVGSPFAKDSPEFNRMGILRLVRA